MSRHQRLQRTMRNPGRQARRRHKTEYGMRRKAYLAHQVPLSWLDQVFARSR